MLPVEGSLRGAVRQSTFDRYEIAIRVHIKPVLGRLKLTKLAPSHLVGFYQDKLAAEVAPARVNKLHVALHKALDQAVKWHMIPRNIAEVVKAPRPSPEEIRPLNREQAKTLLEVAREEDRFEALYMLAVTTGLRQGELLGLKWEDVDLQDGAAHKGGGGGPQGTLGLPDDVQGASRRPLRAPGPRLCYPEGDAGEPYQPQEAVLRAAPREGRPSGYPVS